MGPLKDRGCTDIICILIFIVFLGGMVSDDIQNFFLTFACFSSVRENKRSIFCNQLRISQGVIAYFAFTIGDPWRILNGYDSFGNTCGIKNVIPDGVTSKHSGLDMTGKP